MRKIAFIFFYFLSAAVFAQKLPFIDMNRVRITEPDRVIVAETEPVSYVRHPKPDLIYYWYGAGAIHSTQGGFGGKPLDGLYNEYYPDKNLKEQGQFKKGLKNGIWKSWNDDGTLAGSTNWKHGVEVKSKRRPIWKRIHVHLFKKKPKTDMLNKVKQ
jgi:hypothetical protein